MEKLRRRQWDPPKGGRPPPSPEPSELLPRIFPRDAPSEVWEEHEEKMRNRLAAIDAHREKHRKRRSKSSPWTPERMVRARVVEDVPATLDDNLDKFGAMEGDTHHRDEVDAAFAILALGADATNGQRCNVNVRTSLIFLHFLRTAPLGLLATQPDDSVVDSILQMADLLSSHGPANTILRTDFADVAGAGSLGGDLGPSTHVRATQATLADVNVELLSPPTLMDAMMWEERPPPELASRLPMSRDSFLRVRVWRDGIATENAWDSATASTMAELARQLMRSRIPINRMVNQIERRLRQD
ncbi:hypothetical protein B0H11DRAFT_1899705 [Mycena galericulata]|nr:hypothetical protein B0H11DRAFT_1899705 [Mycena galericulata]